MISWFGDDENEAVTEDQIHQEYTSRKGMRDDLENLLIQAVEAGNMEDAEEMQNMLDGELKPAFKELVYNDTYLDDLNALYEKENGEKYQGSKDELVKDSFDHWNRVEQNVTAGAYELATGFDNLDDGDKKRMKRVFDVYYNTDAFGAGSRNLGEQLWNLIPNTIVDPINLTGIGLGAKAVKGVVGREAMKKGIYMSLGLAAGSGLSGATADVVQQNVEIAARNGDQEYSPGRTAAVAGVSAVMPSAMKKAGQTVGGVVRGVTHPLQTIGRETSGGKTQALLGAINKAEVSSGMARSFEGDAISGNVQTREALSKIWGKAGNDLTTAWNSQPLKKIPTLELDKFMGKMERDPFMDDIIPTDIAKLISGTKTTPTGTLGAGSKIGSGGVSAALGGRKDAPMTDTYSALKDMKQVFFAKAKSDPDNAKHYNRYYKTLVNIEESHAVDKVKFRSMKDAFMGFKNIGTEKGDLIGKTLKDIAEAGPDNATVTRRVDDLINSFLRGTSKSVEQLDGVKKVIEKAAKTAEAGGVKGLGSSWNDFITPVRTAVSERLMANDNKLLHQLLDKTDGMKVLKKLYPESKKDFNNIAKLRLVLKNSGSDRTSGSVIVNMTAARLALQGARAAGGGSVSQALASVSGVYVVGMLSPSRLIENKMFRNAMAKAFKRKDGRIETTTMRKLMKRFKWSEEQAAQVQDSLWTIFTTKPVVTSEETRKKIKNKIQ